MTNEEYIQAFRQWGIDRKIIGNGTFDGQWLKLISEIGELADSLAKGKSPIDDIGDCFVVLVMMEGIKPVATGFVRFGINAFEDSPSPKRSANGHMSALLGCVQEMFCGSIYKIEDASCFLSRIASVSGLTVNECLAHAWNEIKDRKGYLNENGVFIKEDANNVQA